VIVDPLGTAGLRDRVLAAWTASPARFREDANTEEDFALGGYRDRVVVELAQNAADAAVRAGVPGRLLLRLHDGLLTAANDGAPLDAAGVQALSTLRASAKLPAGQVDAGQADAGQADAGQAGVGRTSAADPAADGDTGHGDTGHGVTGHGVTGHGVTDPGATGHGVTDPGAAGDPGAATGRGIVGRFGVGFAAVVAVTDEPAIASRIDGGVTGVMWSAARTRDLVAGRPELAAELDRRTGHVPVLRLPFAAPAPLDALAQWFPDGGFDTVVRLPLRDAGTVDLVRRQLEHVGPALMLALPALERIDIDLDGVVRSVVATHGPGTTTINGATWRTVEAHGDLPPELLADRPTEERARPFWQLRWATADDRDGAGPGLPGDVAAVVHAPTPSAEPLGLPALLIASFPLAPDRRHVADGPLTDFLIERAADEYANLLRALPVTPRLLDLVPGPVAAGALDARLRRAISGRLAGVPLLPTADGTGRRRGRDVVALDGPPALAGPLTGVLPGLLPAGWPVRHPALRVLAVRHMELADVIDELAALDRDPAWWHDLYSALAGADPEALGALPVPLADGRLVRGPRGLLIAEDDLDPADVGVLELRFVDPAAAHPLLIRLGAAPAGPRAVLDDPAVRAAVAGSYDGYGDADPGEAAAVATAVISLVAAARVEPGERPWLAELALPATDGSLYPAGELLLPDAPLRDVVGADAPFGVVDPALVERYGTGTLAATGVLGTFALLREQDVPLAGHLALDLDEEDEWAADVLAALPAQDVPPMLPELTAVRDLELVERWDLALELLARPPLRAAIVEPARVLLADGRSVSVPSYTAWWLRRHPVLGGQRPDGLRAPDADPILAGLYDPAPAGTDPQLLRALGARTSLAEVVAASDDLLARLGDSARTVSPGQLRTIWTALARAARDAREAGDAEVPPDPPDRVRAFVDGAVEVVPAADALVLDHPALLHLLPGQPLVIVPYDLAADLAELLELPPAGEEIQAGVESVGTPRPVPDVVRQILPDAPARYHAHDPLIVAGRSVPWWCEDDTVHVGTESIPGLARGLAWACGRWPDRLLAEAALRSPEAVAVLLAEAGLDS
jgi:hypothetical protein